MLFFDALTLGQPRRTKEGFVAVRARAARAGVYDYLGREVDPEGQHFAADSVVKVYRPEAEVFAKDSVHSFMMKPITDDHPAEPVTADNWSKLAKGVNAGALRDGEYLAFDLVMMDAGLIRDVFPEDGKPAKRELSNGYASEIVIGAGTTDAGDHFDATMRNMRGNHTAVVARGRAGPECRIGDAATCDSIPVDLLERLLGDGETYRESGPGDNKSPHQRRETVDKGVGQVATKIIIVDGLNVEVTEDAERAIVKLQGQLADSATALKSEQDKVATLTTDKATLEGEKAALTKQVEDAKLTPAQLEKLVADRSALIGQAKAVDPKVVTDGKTDAEIRAAVVQSQLGDDAVKLDDEAAVAGAFAVLAKDTKPADPLRNTIKDGIRPNGNAATAVQDARRIWLNNKENAHRGVEVEA